MRRPHVYERSVPRSRRDSFQEPATDPVDAAQAIARVLARSIRTAEAAGLSTLAALLDAARIEAERVG